MYFLGDIYKPRSWKNDRTFKRHLKEWRDTTPDFSMLNDMAETLKELEIVLLYDNSSNSRMYSSLKQTCGTNSFVVDTGKVKITIKLIAEGEVIEISMARLTGTKISSNFKFKNHEGEGYINTVQDAMLFSIIEDTIMKEFCDILKHFYYEGPHRSIHKAFLPTISN